LALPLLLSLMGQEGVSKQVNQELVDLKGISITSCH
jgi:hypothetical protein